MKKAFTLIELVFVIVIIGILSAILAPSFKRDTLQEAADQIASHIRLTQQLALHDNKFEPTNKFWYKERWQIIFSSSAYTDNKIAYSIFSDKPTYSGNPDISELAKNPLNPNQYLSGGYSGILQTSDSRAMKELNIGKKYGITNVTFSGGCSGSGKRVSFDYLGRPLKGNPSSMGRKYEDRLITSVCNIVLHQGTKTKTISIYPETGFVKIN